jgi:hypothetical protein
MAFGDVDTNCAIVGGILGPISSPPEKWVQFCQPMEFVLTEPVVTEPEKTSNAESRMKNRFQRLAGVMAGA